MDKEMILALVVSLAHAAVTNDAAWAAIEAEIAADTGQVPAPGQREELHDLVDLTGAALFAAIDERHQRPARPAHPWAASWTTI